MEFLTTFTRALRSREEPPQDDDDDSRAHARTPQAPIDNMLLPPDNNKTHNHLCQSKLRVSLCLLLIKMHTIISM
jgi:hypothetical protein